MVCFARHARDGAGVSREIARNKLAKSSVSALYEKSGPRGNLQKGSPTAAASSRSPDEFAGCAERAIAATSPSFDLLLMLMIALVVMRLLAIMPGQLMHDVRFVEYLH